MSRLNVRVLTYKALLLQSDRVVRRMYAPISAAVELNIRVSNVSMCGLFKTKKTRAIINHSCIPCSRQQQIPDSYNQPVGGLNLLYIPRVKTNAGTRAFSVAAPAV